MRQDKPTLGQERGEGPQGQKVTVMVDIEQHDGIGGQRHQGVAGGQDIRRAPPDIAQQEAGTVAPEAGVPEGQPQRFGAAGQGGGEEQQAEEEAGGPVAASVSRAAQRIRVPGRAAARSAQAVAKALPSESAKRRRLARIIRATRAMATPRITRLAGT